MHLVETGRLPRHLGRDLNRLRGDRENGDYGVASFFGPEDALEAIRSAEELLAEVRPWLGQEFGTTFG